MTNTHILVLGGTGKTGRRVATHLRAVGAQPRTAARRGADTPFDWADASTYGPALDGCGAVYLVAEGIGAGHQQTITAFLDTAERAGVRHVTYLSALGIDQAPPSVALRAVELALPARTGLTHTILRPHWFMQDFSESFLQWAIVTDDAVLAPTGDGAEAFVDADDIAAVAADTLLHPDRHAGTAYTLSGPQALTFAQTAEHITRATGRTITHIDPPVEQWVAQSLAAGMAADYAELHVGLFEMLRAGHGASISNDVQRVTGRSPKTFKAYAATDDARAAWARP